MTVLGKSSFCNHQRNKHFRQEASTDVISIGWKIIGEQDNHIVSKHYPTDYFLGKKENWNFRMQKTRAHQLNEMAKLGFTKPGTACVLSNNASWSPDAIHAVFKHTHKFFNQSLITRKWDNPDYGLFIELCNHVNIKRGGKKVWGNLTTKYSVPSFIRY